MNMSLTPQEILLRLLAAVLAGVALGVDRDIEGKPAGMRTLGLVALGAASVTVATLYLAPIHADAAAASRVLQGIIQGVLTGIGFLGAGAVLHRKDDGPARGLTTAANVLVVAAVGIACGVGAWWVTLIAAALALALLAVLRPVERHLGRAARARDAAAPGKKAAAD